MQIAELYTYLLKNPDQHLAVLGITTAEYQSLKARFGKARGTKQFNENHKLIAAILIHRYQLTDTSIKNLFFPLADPAISTRVLSKFIGNAKAQLKTGLDALPAVAAHVSPNTALLQYSDSNRHNYHSLDHLLQTIQSAAKPDTLQTSKSLEADDAWMERYLAKKTSDKKKTGQDSFLQMLEALCYDLDDFESKEDYLAWYMAVIFNFNAHLSAYTPITGFGKAQKREMEHPLLYARSQGKHVFGLFYKLLTSANLTAQCLLPKNEPAYKIFRTQFNHREFTKTLGAYNAKGFVASAKKPEKASYFALNFAYSGLRQNLYRTTVEGIQYSLATQTADNLVRSTNQILHADTLTQKPIIKLNKEKIQERIKYAHDLIEVLREKMDKKPFYADVYKELTHYRRQNALAIQEAALKLNLKNLKIVYDRNTNTLDISFYPGKVIEDSANYTEGVTNVIINFFIGLLNHKLNKDEIQVQAQRRQSFAFNRVSITDTTSMCMRVSLGYEPPAFINTFVSSLGTLDRLLTEYNFLDKTTPKLAQGFEAYEKPRTKAGKTAKTGNRYLNVMRSTKKQIKSIATAESALASVDTQHNYESIAFDQYIQALVSFNLTKFEGKLIPVKQSKNNDTLSPNTNVVIGLLTNVLKVALQRADAARAISADHPLAHSYQLTLTKLTKACFKANSLRKRHTEFSASHVYAKTLLLVEDMLEYLVALDTLKLMHEKTANNHQLANQLANLERVNTAHALQQPAENMNVFFTDSGQQALTVSLLALNTQGKTNSIYAYGKCYYELLNNLKDNMGLSLLTKPNAAEFVYVDIREIDILARDIKNLKCARTVTIDITHNPCLADNGMKDIVDRLLKRNITVVIAGSMLKHEQLGLDKFQNGKLIVLSPPKQALEKNIKEELQSISNEAMHPVAASFFLMVNDICRDKLAPQVKVTDVSMFKPVIKRPVAINHPKQHIVGNMA
jgi:hypothetical protein